MAYLYLLATLLFVFGIKRLTSVKTCASGNRLSEIGMAVAVVTTLILLRDFIYWPTVVAGVLAGGGIGLYLAKKTPTTEMPELVAALNGFGGAASALVAVAEVLKGLTETTSISDGGVVAVGRHARRGVDRHGHADRQLRRLRQAVRQEAHPPARGQRAPRRARRARHRRDLARCVDGVRHRQCLADHRTAAAVRGGRRARRAAGHADRRRRHAGRRVAAEQLLGCRRCVRRLRHQQPAAGRRRFAGRRVGPDPDQDHVQGDEPLARQRAARRHGRRGRGRRGRARLQQHQADEPRRGRDAARRRDVGDLRARLRPGGRAGAARRARTRRHAARGAAARCATRSTRSRAACPAT